MLTLGVIYFIHLQEEEGWRKGEWEGGREEKREKEWRGEGEEMRVDSPTPPDGALSTKLNSGNLVISPPPYTLFTLLSSSWYCLSESAVMSGSLPPAGGEHTPSYWISLPFPLWTTCWYPWNCPQILVTNATELKSYEVHEGYPTRRTCEGDKLTGALGTVLLQLV